MTVQQATDPFARAVPIADTILWEGYVLYPYRASSAKNRLRFNWGVVGVAEEPTMASTVVLEPGDHTIDIRVRFLHLVARSDDWDEAEPATHDFTVDVAALLTGPQRSMISIPGSTETNDDGSTRRRNPLVGNITVTAEQVGGGYLLMTTHVRNDTSCAIDDRDEALRHSFIGCHILLASDHDAFVSALEPPDDMADVVAGLEQHRAWPVLIGPEPARDLVLASPVILYDYPGVAKESVGDFYDSTEIDEMLALRVHMLTDDEKAEARALDPRAAAIIDRHDSLEAATMATLHGTIRDDDAPTDPNPEWSEAGPDTALVGGHWVVPGSKVRIEPIKRADVHDMFLKGRVATVAQVIHDIDGDLHVAVTIDDDPGADLFADQKRYLYFAPDELVALP